jgi:hypothetical protein
MGMLLGAILVATGVVCGPFWAKRGIFFHGVGSEREVWQLQQEHDATFVAKPTRQTLDISLNTDGLSRLCSRTYFQVVSGRNTVCFQWASVPGPETQIMDMQSRRLMYRVVSRNHGATVWVHLAHDTQTFLVETAKPGPRAEPCDEGAWRYRTQHMFGPAVAYEQTVSLPPGAAVTRTTPLPSCTEQRDGRQVLEYQMMLEENQTFEMATEYRFASDEQPAGTPVY